MSSPVKGDAKSVAASTTNTRKTTGSNRSVSGRLNAMADDFNNFYGDLDEETTIHKKAEEDRVARMEREIAKIEKVLGTETKRRIEASKALQTLFETKITKLQADFKEELRQVFEPLQIQIDTLVGRVEAIEKTMGDEKRDREKEIQRANKEILDKFAVHQKQFEVEKVTRLQREAQVLKRVGDEVFRMQQKVRRRPRALPRGAQGFAAGLLQRTQSHAAAAAADAKIRERVREAARERERGRLSSRTRGRRRLLPSRLAAAAGDGRAVVARIGDRVDEGRLHDGAQGA